jgi:hypothetical protein
MIVLARMRQVRLPNSHDNEAAKRLEGAKRSVAQIAGLLASSTLSR